MSEEVKEITMKEEINSQDNLSSIDINNNIELIENEGETHSIIIIEEIKDYTVESILQEKLKEFKEVFELLDDEGNGEMPISRLDQFFKSFSIKYCEEEVKKLKEDLKKNSPSEPKNTLNFNTLCKILTEQLSQNAEKISDEEIKQFFELLDKDKDNLISSFDLEAYFGTSLDENNELMNAVLFFNNSKEVQITLEQLTSYLKSETIIQ